MITRPVSFAAVLARLNRKLRHDGEVVRTSRSRDVWAPRFFYMDASRNLCLSVLDTRDDVVDMARECGVLRSTEAVV